MGFLRARGGNCQTCLGKANLLLGLLFVVLLNGLCGDMDVTEQSITYRYCISQKNIFVTPKEV